MSDAGGSIVCIECGGRNRRGEDFCGDCGAYLAWESAGSVPADGTSAPETASAAAEPEAQPRPATPAPSPPLAAAPDHPTVGASDAVTAAPGVTPADAATDADTAARNTDDGGRDQPSTEAAPTRDPDAPALRKPSASSPPRRRTAAPQPTADPPSAPDDITCPACGAGNRPERRFCRRCAARLAQPAVVAASVQPVAGTRPKGRSTRFPFTAVVVLAVLLGLLLVAWLNRDAVIGFVATILGFVFSPQAT